MGSKTNTANGRERVTYIEEEITTRALETIAKESGLTVSTLIRQATWDFVKRNRDKGSSPISRDTARPTASEPEKSSPKGSTKKNSRNKTAGK